VVRGGEFAGEENSESESESGDVVYKRAASGTRGDGREMAFILLR